jgi:hypothetical protein
MEVAAAKRSGRKLAMAKLYPVLEGPALESLRSKAEAKFYIACRDQLPPATLVVHSLALIRLGADGRRKDAESDFVIVDPDRGILVVEVKGGGIDFDPVSGVWSSTGRSGRHAIKDPFRQATAQKHALLEYLRGDPRARNASVGGMLFAHGVMFPDVDNPARLRLPSAPSAIVGGRASLNDIGAWLDGVFVYWAGDDRKREAPGPAGVALCERILCSAVSVRPLLASELATEEIKRVELTRQQSRLLRALGMRRRAMICGGAGTGKTLLALERARELARAGKRVLMLCYNRALSEFLKVAVEGSDGLHAMTFHQLCDWRIRVTRTEVGIDLAAEAERDFPRSNRFDVQLPYALARSTEETALRYDAIIVDEAQDFLSDYWLPIEMLLADASQGLLYAFLDHNQAIYGRAARPPIDDDPFLLTANCRNTRFIHDAAYRHYTGIETDHPEIDGAPFEQLLASTPEAQAGKVTTAVTKLISDEKVSPADIAVLVMKDAKQPIYDAIVRHPLPRGTRWGIEQHRIPNTITIDTVARFKGLEAAVVFLCGFESATPTADREILYVGLSRAKSRVALIGSKEAICRNFG